MADIDIEALRAQGQAIGVRIIGKPDRRSSGEVVIRQWSPKERLARALRTFGIWFFIALLSVAIPILHFFLVPLFLLVAFAMTFIVYSHSSMVLGGAGNCPYCGEALEIVKKPDRWPLDDVCAKCSRHVVIEKA